MNHLTKEEIKKVFAMYQGQEVLCFPALTLKPHWLPPTTLQWHVIAGTLYVTNTILALNPLDKITEDHAIEISDMMGINQKVSRCNLIASAKTYCTTEKNMTYEITQQLIMWGYAVKLYFGKNHWANGKTAIELEIAI